MLRKFFAVLCMFFGILTAAYAGPAANIEYVHKMIAHVWGIEIPYNPELKNPRFAANMEYLLAAVDVANEMLNGFKTTDYKSDPKYATTSAADTIATNTAVNELIRAVEFPFTATTTETTSFSFSISAGGTFYVDWGDGTIERIEKTDTTSVSYSHTYENSGVYKVRLGGRATGYSTNSGAISFSYNKNLAGIEGSLGRIFSTLADGKNPSFSSSFYSCTNLTGTIPENLFAGISGAPASSMFSQTFLHCTGLTGSIPEKLFAGISGTPARYMFSGTFYNCTGLTGEIPENLFAGISGDAADYMFGGSYSTSTGTFDNCIGLTGPSPKIGGKYLYEVWPDATTTQVGHMYRNCTGLTDYADMPTAWK